MKKLVLFLSIVLVIAACRQKEQPAADTTTARGAGFGTTATSATAATATTATGSDVGATMPEYSAIWLDGSKFDLVSKRDKVLLLNVWATWCAPCREEIPELQKLHEKYQPKGFEVVGVSVDESGVESVRQFVAEYKMTFPVVLDPEGKIAGIFQTSVLPTSVLVDRGGRILWKQYGPIDMKDPELVKAIEKVL